MQNSRKTMAIIGMPCWGVRFPFHSLAQVAGIVRAAGWNAIVADLNIELFNTASRKNREMWSYRNAARWLSPTFVDEFYKIHEPLISGLLDNIFSENEVDIVGFSVNDWTQFMSLFAARHLKAVKPDVPIIFGGIGCFPAQANSRLFSHYDDVPDIILQGEAEGALLEFLREYDQRDGVATGLKGFVYRIDGGLVDTGIPDPVNLTNKEIRTDFSGFDFAKYSHPGDFSAFLSRGCFNQCRFCSERNNYRPYRSRKPEDVVSEIEDCLALAKKYKKIPHVYLTDSLINGRVDFLDEFCELLVGKGIEITWGGQAYFRDEMAKPRLEKMHRAGCNGLLWGFETGSQKLLDRMGKNVQTSLIERVLRDCYEVGIACKLPIIVGYPGEDPIDVVDTIEFIIKNKLYMSLYDPNLLMILPNSYLYDHYEDFGLASREQRTWTTLDNKNTLEIRQVRRFLLANCISGTSFRRYEMVRGVDFNKYNVASEIATIMLVLSDRIGARGRTAEWLASFGGEIRADISKEDLRLWTPDLVPPGVSLKNWFDREKNSSARKKRIIVEIVRLIKEMEHNRLEENAPVPRTG